MHHCGEQPETPTMRRISISSNQKNSFTDAIASVTHLETTARSIDEVDDAFVHGRPIYLHNN